MFLSSFPIQLSIQEEFLDVQVVGFFLFVLVVALYFILLWPENLACIISDLFELVEMMSVAWYVIYETIWAILLWTVGNHTEYTLSINSISRYFFSAGTA